MERNPTGLQVLLIIVTVLCVLLAIAFFSFPGYSFSAWVCCGICFVACIYFVLSLHVFRKRKGTKIIRLLLSLILCLGLLLASFTGIYIARAAIGNAQEECDYVIALGAGVNGTTPSLSLRERLNGIYDYMTAHPDAICVVSGGQGAGEEITEAACMYEDLTGRGIDPERIWLEEKATSTQENIAFSLDIIEERTGERPQKAGIVSSEYHLCRAVLMAKDQGLEAVGIPAKTSWVSLRVNYFLREIVALWYYILLGG